jgi:tRNA(fMet)-specific endonuclease VapC
MTYLLDTDTLSQFSRGHPAVLQRVKETSPSEIAISTVTYMEIEYGLALQSAKARKLRPILQAFFNAIRLLPFDEQAVKATAALRATLKIKGTPIGAYDALIAGTALAKGLIVVTGNTREYERIGGLMVENWLL